ncbi:MAG: hypothetical protein MJ196_09610 [Treponemataceae bacterium]|nr:hypothetical protein [Treponemataceae bacterium]
MWQNNITQATANISINHDPANAQGIKNGDFVFVRVLGQTKTGATVVSFAGQRFEVKTQNPVQTGQSFKAQVQIENNSIKLIPQETNAAKFNSQNLPNNLGIIDAGRMLAASGLAVTEANLKLLQFAKENMTAFNRETLLKLQKKLAKYGKNAKTAAEIEAFLADKGINATDEQIEELLLLLDMQNNGENRQNNPNQNPEGLLTSPDNENGEDIFTRLFANFSQALTQKPGLLTLANHIGGQNTHWVVLPFTTEFAKKSWSGSLRFLCDPKQKHTEKFYLSAKNEEKGLIFEFFLPKNMYTGNKKLRVFFAQTPAASFSQQKRLCSLLNDCLNQRFAGINGFSSQIVYRQQVAEEVFVDTSVCVYGVDQIV